MLFKTTDLAEVLLFIYGSSGLCNIKLNQTKYIKLWKEGPGVYKRQCLIADAWTCCSVYL
jgi:hypothetical protein